MNRVIDVGLGEVTVVIERTPNAEVTDHGR